MKRLSLLVVLLGFFLPVKSQHWQCGTGDAPHNVLDFISHIDFSDGRLQNRTMLNLPTTIHILQNNAGQGAFSSVQAFDLICHLNDQTADAGLFFYLPGPVNFIPNDTFLTMNNIDLVFDLMVRHNVLGTVNIYFTNLSQLGFCGLATFPGSGPGNPIEEGAIIMSFACSTPDRNEIVHEVGHFFGLPHTFDGTVNAPASLQAERVTRLVNETGGRLPANCQTAGDRFCDTPADFIGTRWVCPTGLSATDWNGDVFRPDSSMFMSYSQSVCMSRFSEQQITAMRARLADSSRAYLLANPMPPFGVISQGPQAILPDSSSSYPANSIPFRWRAVPGATSYQVRVYFMNVLVFDTTVTDTAFTSTNRAIRANRVHQWEVRAYNGANLCAPFSPRSRFSTTLNVSVWEQAQQSTTLRLSPNFVRPAEKLRLELDDYTGPMLLVWYDVGGKKVQQIWLDVFEGHAACDAPFLEAGTYIVQAHFSHHSAFQKVFVRP